MAMLPQFCTWAFFCSLHLLKWGEKMKIEKKKVQHAPTFPYSSIGTGKLWSKSSLWHVCVKFFWNTAILLCLHTVCDCFYVTMAELCWKVENLWQRPHSSQNLKYLLSSTLEKKFANSTENALPILSYCLLKLNTQELDEYVLYCILPK